MQLLAIIFLIIGIILLLIEILIPGFGVFGIFGVILIVTSFYMTTLFFKFGIIIVLLEMILALFIFYMLIKKMKRMQLFGKIVLSDSVKNKKEFANLEEFIGREGITKTALRPTGDAEFNGIIIEVISENGYIENNIKIKVTRILENKLYVKQLNCN